MEIKARSLMKSKAISLKSEDVDDTPTAVNNRISWVTSTNPEGYLFRLGTYRSDRSDSITLKMLARDRMLGTCTIVV